MKKIILFILVVSSCQAFSQDSLLTYTRIIKSDSLSKDQIYDKTSIWCGKRFDDSKYAIKVADKSSGIISGKASFTSPYRVPKGKDSTDGQLFTSFAFNWVIEIKDHKLRIKIDEIIADPISGKYPLHKNYEPCPVSVLFQRKIKSDEDWNLSKKYLLKNLDRLFDELENKLKINEGNW